MTTRRDLLPALLIVGLPQYPKGSDAINPVFSATPRVDTTNRHNGAALNFSDTRTAGAAYERSRGNAMPVLVAPPDASADASYALQSLIDSVASRRGGDVRVPAGTYRLDTEVTVRSSIRLLLDHSATFVHGADCNLFRMKPRSHFIGGTIDVSGTANASFSSAIFGFDGAEAKPGFRGVQPTVVRTEILGQRGRGTGTAFHLQCTADEAHIYGVEIEATIDGLEIGALFEKVGPRNTCWINGNRISLRAIATVNLFKTVNNTDGVGVDGNSLQMDYQTIPPYTKTIVDIRGRYNRVDGMIWDASSGVAVRCSSGSTGNLIVIGGLLDATVRDQGRANTLLMYTASTPTLRISGKTW